MSSLSTIGRRRRPYRNAAAAVSLAALLAISACSTGNDDEHADEHSTHAQEVESAQARILVTYDGGYLTLDGATLDVISDEQIEGFNRLNPVGDGRHALLSTSEGFRLIDAGVWTQPHGDHTHSYAGDPVLTETVFATDTPGHAVSHGGNLALFGDGDGKIQLFDVKDFLTVSGSDDDDVPEPTVHKAAHPHHGVAIKLANGTLLHTEGTADHRDTVIAIDADGTKIASSNDCPGVHGEATAAGEAVSFGCEDGVLLYKNGTFTKVTSDDPYGRTGTQAGSDTSSVILGDYKVHKNADLERPTRVKLTNTESNTARLVELGTSYSSRSLARGPKGEALVLGTDGKLHVIDPNNGTETAAWSVVGKWEEPTKWQSARPSLFVQGARAYVTEPVKSTMHVVDLSDGRVLASATLPHSPNELTGVTG